jgi:hypothetical protein
MAGYGSVPGGDAYAQEREAHIIIDRTINRRITLTSLFLDFTIVLYTAVCIAFIMNVDRLIYDQSCATVTSWTWWRLYFPQVSIVIGIFVWILVFYGRFETMLLYIFAAAVITGFDVVAFVYLCIDWNQCNVTLWCADLSWYSLTGKCDESWVSDQLLSGGPRDVFIINFAFLLTIIVFNCVMIALSLWIAAVYSKDIKYNQNSNAGRMGSSIARAIDTVIDNSSVLSTMRDSAKAYAASKRRKVYLPRPEETSY